MSDDGNFDDPPPLSAEDAHALLKLQRSNRINSIVQKFGRNPTDFEYRALSVLPIALPLIENGHPYLETTHGFKIKYCKRALQLLLDCQLNENVSGLHEAGTLLSVVVEKQVPGNRVFTISSGPPLPSQYGHHAGTHGTAAASTDSLGNPQIANTAGNGLSNLSAAAYGPRPGVVNGYFQPGQASYSGGVASKAVPKICNPQAFTPSGHPPGISHSYGSSSLVSPASGKRSFSASMSGTNSTMASGLYSTPSPKRRGTLSGLYDTNVDTGRTKTEEYLASLQKLVTERKAAQSTTIGNTQPALHPAIRTQNISSASPNHGQTEEPLDYSKQYRIMAEKNGIKPKEAPPEHNPSRPYSSPYNPETERRSNNTLGSIQTPSGVAPVAPMSVQNVGRGSIGLPHASTQQHSVFDNQALHKWNEQVRMQLQYAYQMKGQQQAASGLGNVQAGQSTEQGIAGVLNRQKASNLGSQGRMNAVSSSYLAAPYQPAPGLGYANNTQNASGLQNAYAVQQPLELSRQMAEEHARKSHIIQPLGSSADPTVQAPVSNPSLGLRPSSYQLNSVPVYFSQNSTNGTSMPHLQAEPGTGLNPYVPYDTSRVSTIPYGTAQNADGFMTQTRENALDEVLPNTDITPSTPPAYQRIEATPLTGPLPNINQEYTGSPGSLPFMMQPKYLPVPPGWPAAGYSPVPFITPTKKKATPKKKTPRSQTKKTPESQTKKKTPKPRKSRAKAKNPLHSNEQATTALYTTSAYSDPLSIAQGPLPFSFSSSTSTTLDSTVEAIKNGDFSQFFKSPEEEQKWKQDALDRAMAAEGTPSKYPMKQAESERKDAEMEMKAQQWGHTGIGRSF